jgi:tRNA threonylcarbamoyladenosine biosynthesis protein TsaB
MALNLLAFDCSTDRFSIAVSRHVGNVETVWQSSGSGAAHASAGLVGGVLDLLRQAGLTLHDLDAICFGSGPGSFTGLRTACSVAQGLAFACARPVLPIGSLLTLAQEAALALGEAEPARQFITLLDARMDELYASAYCRRLGQWQRLHDDALVRPDELCAKFPVLLQEPQAGEPALVVCGNVFDIYGARLALPASVACVSVLPQAGAMLRLAPQLLAQGKAVAAHEAMPVYIRDKVAKTTQERVAEKAALVVANSQLHERVLPTP